MEQGILLAALAGMGGTGLGGLIAVLWGKKSLPIQGLLYFTAGIMLGMAFFDLLPEAVAHGALWVVALGLLGGGLLVWIAEKAEAGQNGEKQGRMVSAGLMMLAALMLHNLPEGFGSSCLGKSRPDRLAQCARRNGHGLSAAPGGICPE